MNYLKGPLKGWGKGFPTQHGHYQPSIMLFSKFIHMVEDLKRLLNFKYISAELNLKSPARWLSSYIRTFHLYS